MTVNLCTGNLATNALVMVCVSATPQAWKFLADNIEDCGHSPMQHASDSAGIFSLILTHRHSKLDLFLEQRNSDSNPEARDVGPWQIRFQEVKNTP